MRDQTSVPAPDATKAATRKARADVLVDLGLCKACGICIALCPTQVFDRDAEGRAVVARLDDCTACRLCEWHCPDFAIEVLVRGQGGDADGAAEQGDDAGGVAAGAARAEEDA